MQKPTIQLHNMETNEIEIREMTDEEIVKYEADNNSELEEKVRQEQRQQLRKAILDRLGLSEEEAKLLLS